MLAFVSLTRTASRIPWDSKFLFVGVEGVLHPEPVGEGDGVTVEGGLVSADVRDELVVGAVAAVARFAPTCRRPAVERSTLTPNATQEGREEDNAMTRPSDRRSGSR